MCIAGYKKLGVSMPSKKELRNCWENNPDGAGYMYLRDNLWCIDKGYLEFKDFWRALRKNKFNEKSEVVFHFRWATSGKTDAGCTHPFPITNNVKDMRETVCVTKQAMVHNGVFDISGEGDLSDTMVFVRDTLYSLRNFLGDSEIMDYLELVPCAFQKVLITNGPDVYLMGNWQVDKKTGMIWTNTDYKKKPKITALSAQETDSSWLKRFNNRYGYLDSEEEQEQYSSRIVKDTSDPEELGSYRWVPYCLYCADNETVAYYDNDGRRDLYTCIACGAVFDSHGKEYTEYQ